MKSEREKEVMKGKNNEEKGRKQGTGNKDK